MAFLLLHNYTDFITSKDIYLNEAVAYMKSSFFKDNIEAYGEITAHNFKQAIQELK
ncbi:hypothetical protein EYQ96_06135 [Staphylococcus warneri]|uniref:hypothetical protein n=1 Tax=Staphylococcus warneri TaxID=1292 RepID=UPI00148F03D6|nr:hypothetical protein [Staphylococcus warneri]QJX55686.1 hypothetical protein EYQ96_06135 [Staphylococcus warneri]